MACMPGRRMMLRRDLAREKLGMLPALFAIDVVMMIGAMLVVCADRFPIIYGAFS